MKTAELTGAALDWAVAVCEKNWAFEPDGCDSYSNDWELGGAIIERENVSITGTNFPWWECDTGWYAHIGDRYSHGETPLVAAMRCYVASKLGDEVEVPEELMTAA